MGGTQISITTGTIVKTLLILIGAWLLWYLRDVVLIVLTAIVVASALEPAVAALRRWKVPRLVAVIFIYLLLALFLVGIFYFFMPLILDELAAFLASLPVYLTAIDSSPVLQDYSAIFGLPGGDTSGVMESVRAGASLTGLFGNSFSAAASIFTGLFAFILVVVFSFYFTVAETGVDDFLRVIVPKKHQSYALDLWFRSRHKIGLWMQGQLILAVIIGVMVYLSLMILGIKHALLLAVFAAVFELIPVFGPTLAAVPAVLIGFAEGGVSTGLIIIFLYVIIQQFENHLIYPVVVTQVVGVPPLLVILGLIAGWNLAGFLGIVLSVPMAAVLQELVRDLNHGKMFAGEGGKV
ncbi:AI-2E family transporter [bacterium]|nr:AI-2E family transporter [bacterium]